MLSTPYIERAEPHEDHTITLHFENGERKQLDMKPYLETPAFRSLQDLSLFRQVRVVHGSLEWPGERDLAYDSLYAEAIPMEEEG
ncbi:MAG: DUF2442 domain-containing protein [Rhodothermales bacterium]